MKQKTCFVPTALVLGWGAFYSPDYPEGIALRKSGAMMFAVSMALDMPFIYTLFDARKGILNKCRQA
ncbi:MAG: hypothetical protein WD604_09425 [Balneolaceae bacterium]